MAISFFMVAWNSRAYIRNQYLLFIGIAYLFSEQEREKLIIVLQTALSEVKTLRGFIPICAKCKKIRDDKGFWNQIESYISEHSKAEFSHNICPDCVKKLYPELNIK